MISFEKYLISKASLRIQKT